MKFILKVLLTILSLSLYGFANQNLAVIYTFDKNIDDRFNVFTKDDLKTIGYFLNDPHERVNKVYEERFGSTDLSNLAFSSIVHEATVRPMFNIDPRLAGFNPFNLLIYRSKNETQTHIAHLTPKAILDILEIKNEKLRSEYIKSFEPLDAMIEEKLGGKKSFVEISEFPKDSMMNFEYEFEEPEDIDDFLDEFQEKFESAFRKKNYIIAGFYNFKESFNSDEDVMPDYTSFWAYALCHLEFSYKMFDGKKGTPLAGIFAPCSMYMYIRKGSNKMVIGMPTLNTWGKVLGIKDETKQKVIDKLDKEIPEIMMSLGAKEVGNGNPLTKEIEKSTDSSSQSKSIAKLEASIKKLEAIVAKLENVVSKVSPIPSAKQKVTQTAVPTSKDQEEIVVAKKVANPSNSGAIIDGKISAFLIGKYAPVSDIVSALKRGGFKVLATSGVDKKNKLITIIATTKTLQEMGSKNNRGFMGVIKILVDSINKQISITNPLYFAKAYLQDDFDESKAKKVLEQINNSFEGLKNSEDKMKFDKLSNYNFMKDMPHYQDMDIVAKGDNSELLEKVRKKSNFVFELKLSNQSTLVGIKLGKRTAKFTKKAGFSNASILPYLVLVEDGKAKILSPKYNIALYYPMLTLMKFSDIATAPGAIIKESEKAFK